MLLTMIRIKQYETSILYRITIKVWLHLRYYIHFILKRLKTLERYVTLEKVMICRERERERERKTIKTLIPSSPPSYFLFSFQINLNSSITILFSSPRSRSMISHFFIQLCQDKKKKQFLERCYNYCMELSKYSYLVCRTDIETPNLLRYMTRILPNQWPVLTFSQEQDDK